MRGLDRLHLEFPFAGSRMLRDLLAAERSKIGRRHVKTLMRRMGVDALYRRWRTTKPEPGHKIYSYLLRGTEITRPNQVWAMDITYIRLAAPSISRRCLTGSGVGCCRGASRSRWKPHSASRRWRTLSLAMASRKSSTPTKARSSRAPLSPACSPVMASLSAWTVGVPGATTC